MISDPFTHDRRVEMPFLAQERERVQVRGRSSDKEMILVCNCRQNIPCLLIEKSKFEVIDNRTYGIDKNTK